MRKAIIAMIVLLVISIFTAVISLAVCGGELIVNAVEYGVKEYREYRFEEQYEEFYDDTLEYDDYNDFN